MSAGRLAELEREIARLRYRHDVAMSAFRFEEATALGPAIAALEKERAALAASLPPPLREPTGVVPRLPSIRRGTAAPPPRSMRGRAR